MPPFIEISNSDKTVEFRIFWWVQFDFLIATKVNKVVEQLCIAERHEIRINAVEVKFVRRKSPSRTWIEGIKETIKRWIKQEWIKGLTRLEDFEWKM